MNNQLLEKLILMLLNNTDSKTTSNEQQKSSTYKEGDYVIIRSYYSGVLYGKYMGRSKDGIILHDSRRLRYRQSAKGISLSELSLYGVKKDSKITEPVDIEVTDPTVCEILVCSKECIKSINAMPNYQP